MSHYIARLHAAIQQKGNPVCVGLDPRFEQLPRDVIESASRDTNERAVIVANAYEQFCRRVIDVVAPLVPVVKPQAAFFEEWGPSGCAALGRVIRHARDAGLLVICDAKRGDIGSTAEAYARGYLAGSDPNAAAWGADALTINPYLGRDTLEPFVQVAKERGAGLYVLVRTSNPGAGTFQDLRPGDRPLYAHVAEMVEQLAAATCADQPFGAVGAVVGATYPQELAELRRAMQHTHLLIPGYGSQGGTAADVAHAFMPSGLGAVINNSRGLIFAHEKKEYATRFAPNQWEQAVESATRTMIADLSAHIIPKEPRTK